MSLGPELSVLSLFVPFCMFLGVGSCWASCVVVFFPFFLGRVRGFFFGPFSVPNSDSFLASLISIIFPFFLAFQTHFGPFIFLLVCRVLSSSVPLWVPNFFLILQ